MTDGALPPAGWYPVQGDSDTERYWDGAQWTDHVRTVDATVQMPTSANPTIAIPSADLGQSAQDAPAPGAGGFPPPGANPQPLGQQPPSSPGFGTPQPEPASSGSSNRGMLVGLVAVLGLGAVAVIGFLVASLVSGGDDEEPIATATTTAGAGESVVDSQTTAADSGEAGAGDIASPFGLGATTSVTDRSGVATWEVSIDEVVTLPVDEFFADQLNGGTCVAVVGTATLSNLQNGDEGDFFLFPEVSMIDDGSSAQDGFLPCQHRALADASSWVFELEAGLGETVGFYVPYVVTDGNWDSLSIGDAYYR